MTPSDPRGNDPWPPNGAERRLSAEEKAEFTDMYRKLLARNLAITPEHATIFGRHYGIHIGDLEDVIAAARRAHTASSATSPHPAPHPAPPDGRG